MTYLLIGVVTGAMIGFVFGVLLQETEDVVGWVEVQLRKMWERIG